MPLKLARAIPHQVVLCAVAFVAILPLLFRGPSCGHDFEFHLLSWLEASRQLAHYSYAHWAFSPAWGAGEPRFLFYPPLSWTLGAVLGLMLPWNFVAIAFTWIALSIAGLTLHRLAIRYVDANAALLAATFYVVNPYMLFTAYERTAYGELLAAAWLPLLFAAMLAIRVRIVPIGVALALIWLTNAPAGVMSSYALAFVTIVRLAQSPKPVRAHLATKVAAGTALAFALAGFFLVPAVYEQRFVQVNMAVTTGMRPADHTLFHRMAGKAEDNAYHDGVVRAASLIAVTMLSGIAITLLYARRNRSTSQRGGSAFALIPLTIVIAFLLTPASLYLWSHIPKLAFLQFPWRLCALLGVTLALTIALALKNRLPSTPYSLLPIPCLLLATAISFPLWHLFHQACDGEDTVPYRVALFHSNSGADATDEYTPVGADGDALKKGNPPYWLLSANADIHSALPAGPAPDHFSLNVSQPYNLVLNRRQYPHWQIRLNGTLVAPASPEREDGLITLKLPAGQDTVDLVWASGLDQTIGLVISVFAGAITLALARKKLFGDSSDAQS